MLLESQPSKKIKRSQHIQEVRMQSQRSTTPCQQQVLPGLDGDLYQRL